MDRIEYLERLLLRRVDWDLAYGSKDEEEILELHKKYYPDNYDKADEETHDDEG